MIKVVKFNTALNKGTFIEVDRDDALRLNVSLARQVSENNANTGRAEFRTDKNEYFSIGVQEVPR